MPSNIKIIHPSDFIRTTMDGALDLSTSIRTLVNIAARIKTPGEFQILIDIREAQVQLSTTDVFELGVAVASYPSIAHSKTALLTAMDGAQRAQFLQLVAQNRGALLRAFTSFEEAITWLIMKEKKA